MSSEEVVARTILIGIGGAAAMDVWAAILRVFGVSSLDYALVGRWVGHLGRGRLRHAPIGASPTVAGEQIIGYATHYLIGVAFAAVLLVARGAEWATAPTPAPALVVGLGTVVAPWFVMQPAFGAGIAGARLPNPWSARVKSLATHAVFGGGMYVTALVVETIVG